MSNFDIKALTEKVNEASEAIKGELGTLRSDFTALDKIVADLQVKGKRPNYQMADESKSADPEFSAFLTKGAIPHESKSLSVTNDGQGVTVRSEWTNDIFKLIRESSPVRQVARVMNTNSDSVEVLIDRDEPNSAWIGELTARTETDASFLTRQKIAVHEHYALPSVTLQMLEDSQFNVEQWLQSKIDSRFSRQEASAFINGDGVGKPRGLLDYGFTANASFVWGADPDLYTIGALDSGAAGDLVDADVLVDLVDSLKAPYLANAGWMMTRAMRNKVRKLKDLQDRYLFEPSLQAGVPDRLLGYPVYLAEDMPALADGACGALFGDFSQAYTIVDRVGLTVQRDSVTRPGWVKYYVRRRVGGALTNPEAVKALLLQE